MAGIDFNFYLHVPVLASGKTMETEANNKLTKTDAWGNEFTIDRITYEEIFTQYSDRFNNIYDQYKQDILDHLKLIGFDYDDKKQESFAEQLVAFLKEKIKSLNETTEANLKDANLCLKALEALDYYVNEIIVAFNLFDEYIQKAKEQLKLLEKCKDEITKEAPKLEDYKNDENSTAEEQYEAARTEYYEAIDKNQTLAHINITNLKIYDKFCMDIVNKFAQCLDATLYAGTDTTVSLGNSALTLNYSNIKNLRETKLKKNTVFSNFNQLNLLDRFIYTCLYCSLTQGTNADGKRAYFPDDPMVGYPCLPTKKNQSPSEIDTEIGALEMFYIGYLIDRDGPVNALSTFMDVKVEALRRNIELNMNKIEALNKYLTLFNLALQEVNRTQSKEKENPIPGFARFVAYYLAQNGCLREMININGENYIIMAHSYTLNDAGYHVSNGKEQNNGNNYPTYLLIKATDEAFNELKNKLNGGSYENDDHPYYSPSSPIATIDGDKITATGNNNFYKIWAYNDEYTFLPKELEIATVTAPEKWGKDKMTTNNIQAWTTVFSTKTDYINHRIETINTDISTLRTKIDTFESASSTYRNRAHDTYSNIIRNIS